MNWIKRLFTKKPKPLPPFKPIKLRDDENKFRKLSPKEKAANRDRLCYERLEAARQRG